MSDSEHMWQCEKCGTVIVRNGDYAWFLHAIASHNRLRHTPSPVV